MRTHHVHPTQRNIIVGFSLLLLATAGGTGWWAWRATTSAPNQPSSVLGAGTTSGLQQKDGIPTVPQTKPLPKTVPLTTIARATPPITAQQQALQPQIYWLKVEGQQIRLLPKPVALKASVSPEQALMEGMINLLANPNRDNVDSAIPAGTRLLNLHVTAQGIYVNLSREFSQGGGSRSMIYRVAQILYTATSLDPTAKVYLSIEGQPLDETHPLGGEGLMLRHPLTRQQFTTDFSFS